MDNDHKFIYSVYNSVRYQLKEEDYPTLTPERKSDYYDELRAREDARSDMDDLNL